VINSARPISTIAKRNTPMNKLNLTLRAGLLIGLFSQIALAHDEKELPVEDAEKLIIKVSESGFEPSAIKFHKEDSSLFVVNSSKSSLLTISFDFKGKKTHCASSNMSLSGDGILKSNAPIAPKDFAALCIPEKGKYDLVAYGITPKPLHASIEVE